MAIKIENETRRLKTMIRLSGRLQSKHLDELKTQLAGARSRIAVDLNGVTLVDVEIVRFLVDP
jgi:anti-anti-sigma regulatory factor